MPDYPPLRRIQWATHQLTELLAAHADDIPAEITEQLTRAHTALRELHQPDPGDPAIIAEQILIDTMTDIALDRPIRVRAATMLLQHRAATRTTKGSR